MQFAQPKFKVNTSCLEAAIQKFVHWGDSGQLELNSLLTDLPLMKQFHTLLMKPRDLSGFIQLTNSIKYQCIPDPDIFMVSLMYGIKICTFYDNYILQIKESYLGITNSFEMIHFLERYVNHVYN